MQVMKKNTVLYFETHPCTSKRYLFSLIRIAGWQLKRFDCICIHFNTIIAPKEKSVEISV